MINVKTTCRVLGSFILMFYLNCSTGTKVKTYRHINTKKLNSRNAVLSRDKIDNYRTYEIYFTMEKKVKSLKIIISSTTPANIFTGKKIIKKVYYILEKKIDLSRFKRRDKIFIYSELSRNFDGRWNRKRELIIKTASTDPIHRLDNTSQYRIRFTTFTTEELDFTITIHADSVVTITNR